MNKRKQPPANMTKAEAARDSHEIATNHPTLEAGSEPRLFLNRDCFYIFTVNYFGSYNFLLKDEICGNEEFLRQLRKELGKK